MHLRLEYILFVATPQDNARGMSPLTHRFLRCLDIIPASSAA